MSNPRQDQRSEQSVDNPADAERQQGGPADKAGSQNTGIGSSQGQDRERREERPLRTGQGTADIERGGAGSRGGTDSLVDDTTGAFKERP